MPPELAPPPPWACAVRAVVWVDSMVRGTVAARVDYVESPVGGYREAFAGVLRWRRGRPHLRVPLIAVDSAASQYAGRAYWNLPKVPAEFRGAVGDAVLAVQAAGWHLALDVRPVGPAVPVVAPLLLAQPAATSALRLRGRGRLAVVTVRSAVGSAAVGRRLGCVVEGRLDAGRPAPAPTRPWARYAVATGAPRPAHGFVSRWTTVGAFRMHSRDSVSHPSGAPPLVLVHGLAVSHRYLMPAAALLAGRYAVRGVDLPGFGLTTPRPAAVLGVGELADLLVRWLDAVGLQRVAMLGNSFGCQVAVDLAVRYPGRVSALVLSGPTMDPGARSATRHIGRFLRDAVREDPTQVGVLARDVRDAGVRRVFGTLRHALRDRIEEKLPRVDVPTVVTRGAREPIVPQAWAERAAELTPYGRLVVLPGPHNSGYSSPQALAAAVTDLLG